MTSPSSLLETSSLGRRGNDHDTWLLRDVSLAVRAGDRIGIVGPTGAGKTLLLRALALLDPPDEGEVRSQGRAVRGQQVPEFRTQVVYLHQRPALAEGTVEDNLRLPFRFEQHRGKRFDRQRAIAWFAALARDETFLARRPHELSGGESQLAALVRAMLLEPHVLLLDEPTAALDGGAVKAVERLITNWVAELPDQRAYVWVSHDRGQTDRLCNRILPIHAGRLSDLP